MSDETCTTEPTADAPVVIEMTVGVVAAYISKNHVRVAELPDLIAIVHGSLAGMGSASEVAMKPAKLVPPMPIRKTITDTHIISLEDGKQYISLKRHLSKHGLTPAEYRAKWGLPHDYPMVSPAYSRHRSVAAKAAGLGAQRRKH